MSAKKDNLIRLFFIWNIVLSVGLGSVSFDNLRLAEMIEKNKRTELENIAVLASAIVWMKNEIMKIWKVDEIWMSM